MANTKIPVELSSTPGIVDNSNATAITIDSSENVGIGTSSPTGDGTALHIHGSTHSTLHLTNSTTGSTVSDGFDIITDGSDAMLRNRETGAIKFRIGSSEAMRIDSSRNVGIGTSSPSEKLSINNASGNAYVQCTSGNGNLGGVWVGDQADEYVGAFLYDNSTDASLFWTNNAERMRIDSSGNVAIGDTSSRSFRLYLENAGSSGAGQLMLVDSDNSGLQREIRTDAGVLSFDYWDGSNRSNHLTILANGNVGIGTSSPQAKLQLLDANAVYLQMTDSGNIAGRVGVNGSYMHFGLDGANGETERMRIDSSGTFMVAKTSASSNSVGFETSSTGNTAITRSGGQCLLLNRQSSDGYIVEFRKDGGAVGRIATKGGLLAIGDSDCGIAFEDGTTNHWYPWNIAAEATSDNIINIGAGSARFDNIYATNGTIQTSDRNEKQDIEALTDAETRVAVAAKGLLKKFRWINRVEEKGDEARIHFGIIAQDLQDAFTTEGLDASDYAMFISSTWTDDDGVEQTRLGVRYSELLAFIIAAI